MPNSYDPSPKNSFLYWNSASIGYGSGKVIREEASGVPGAIAIGQR